MAIVDNKLERRFETPGYTAITVPEESDILITYVIASGGGGGGGWDGSHTGGSGGRGVEISGQFLAPAGARIDISVAGGGGASPTDQFDQTRAVGGINGDFTGNGGNGSYGHSSGSGGAGGACSILKVNGEIILVAGGGGGGGGAGFHGAGQDGFDGAITNNTTDLPGSVSSGLNGVDSNGDGAGAGAGGGGSMGGASGYQNSGDNGAGGGEGGGSFWTTDYSLSATVVSIENQGSGGGGAEATPGGHGYIYLAYIDPELDLLTVSIGDLNQEFANNRTRTGSMSEFYRGIGLVPDITDNLGVPTSGTISLSDFYGSRIVNVPGPEAEVIPHPDGDNVYRYNESGTFTIFAAGEVSFLIVGGGANPSINGDSNVGGGGGEVVYQETYFLEQGEYSVYIGQSDEATIFYKEGVEIFRANPGTGNTSGNGFGPGSYATRTIRTQLQNGAIHNNVMQGWGGGGGANAVGSNGAASSNIVQHYYDSWGGTGGAGLVFDITGSNITYGGGGGGNASSVRTNGFQQISIGNGGAPGAGGVGGGGAARGNPGVDGLGGGGGGVGGLGGSGTFIIKGPLL